jgi:hypothetical protein
MDHKDFAIGVLSITATILVVGLILVTSQPPPALAAAGPGVQSGDYVLTTGQFQVDEDLLYVLDATAQRMVVYRFDIRSRSSFAPVDGIDLAALREQAAPGQPQGQQPRRGGQRP